MPRQEVYDPSFWFMMAFSVVYHYKTSILPMLFMLSTYLSHQASLTRIYTQGKPCVPKTISSQCRDSSLQLAKQTRGCNLAKWFDFNLNNSIIQLYHNFYFRAAHSIHLNLSAMKLELLQLFQLIFFPFLSKSNNTPNVTVFNPIT